MTKKSAARIKTIKAKNPDVPEQKPLPPIEETFEKMKEGFITILETSVVLAKRVDNLDNVRRYAISFWEGRDKEMGILYFKRLQDISIETYKELLDTAKQFSLEEFSKEDMKDYFDYLMTNRSDILSEQDLLEAMIVFHCVKPFGEKMNAMHQQILDEIKQREYLERGE